MSVAPSCPVLLIHEDDEFRKKLIAALDERHFSVTFCCDGPDALSAIHEKPFRVIVIGLDIGSRVGMAAFDYVRDHDGFGASVILVCEPNANMRDLARTADETLLKPVDPVYVAERARVYC